MVRVITEEQIHNPKDTTPLYEEGVHMLDGLADEEVDHFLEDHPRIVPLFDMDIKLTVSPYVSKPTEEDRDIGREPHSRSIEELCHARDTLS